MKEKRMKQLKNIALFRCHLCVFAHFIIFFYLIERRDLLKPTNQQPNRKNKNPSMKFGIKNESAPRHTNKIDDNES